MQAQGWASGMQPVLAGRGRTTALTSSRCLDKPMLFGPLAHLLGSGKGGEEDRILDKIKKTTPKKIKTAVLSCMFFALGHS